MAVSEVFADTSALYALVNRRDSGHDAAKEAVGRLVRAGRKIVITDYVLAETLNLANARGGSLVASRVIDLVEQSAGIRMEWSDSASLRHFSGSMPITVIPSRIAPASR